MFIFLFTWTSEDESEASYNTYIAAKSKIAAVKIFNAAIKKQYATATIPHHYVVILNIMDMGEGNEMDIAELTEDGEEGDVFGIIQPEML